MPDLLPALAGMLAVSMPELKSRALALVLASIPARGEETVRNLAKGTAQEAAQTAQQAAQTAEQAAQKLWEEEVAAWRTLLTRDAISEHFEEFYLDALKACISEALELERKNGDSERRSL